MMLDYKKINNITGWVIFGIAALVYTLTVEPTASFWDCGEFIAASFKLQVPHPPGAPLFLLIGRLFSMLAGADVTKVAFWINISSALASAFTSLFLFWSITLLGRRIFKITDFSVSTYQTIMLMGSGIVGALAYTFCDSAWFSAVEAEVYALSSFFTAFVVWAMFKWELIEDERASNRWLILIAYMIGLSIGVHLLNLVALPALGFIYYFKKYKYSIQGALAAFAISCVIIITIMSGVIPGLPSMAFAIEKTFVNSLGMPFGSGIDFFMVVALGALIFGLYFTQKKAKVLWNTVLLALTFVLIGYTSYTSVLIRSNFNPPINENDPSDIIKFVSYLKREQYGDRPLFFGPSFMTPIKSQEPDKNQPLYRKGKEKYEVYDYRYKTEYESNGQMLFPRLFSKQDGHSQLYMQRLGLDKNHNGKIDANEKPNFGHNLFFFFDYQLKEMYFRYFMWNFAGKESDLEGAGYLKPWNISTKGLPDEIAKNKGRNQFFMLPLFLGLLGFFFQAGKDKRGAVIVFLLFFLTGIALIIYLNSPPTEPRERDYIYVGSYYAFAMWIGLGVMAIAELLSRFITNNNLLAIASTALCLIVPGIMLQQGYDDHDRSKRYHSVDSAKNLLNSCAPNAILFTGGDNDTFPLWYAQEVEGFRTDVRVCNLSLLGTDWYIEQMKRKAYLSEPLPIKLPFDRFIQGTNDQIVYFENENLQGGMNVIDYMKLIRENNPAVQYQLNDGRSISVLPTNKLFIPIDSAALSAGNLVPEKLKPNLRGQMSWKLPPNDIFKPELVMLDIIANNSMDGWKRPIYFSTTIGQPGNSNFVGITDYLQLEGLAYRLMPVKVEGATMGFINTDIMYENMTKKMFWREMDNPKVYYDENYRKFPMSARLNFYRLAQQLSDEGDKKRSKETINHCFKVLPDNVIPFDRLCVNFVPLLYSLEEKKRANDMAAIMYKRSNANLEYFINSSKGDKSKINMEDIQDDLIILSRLSNFYKEKEPALGKTYEDKFNSYYQKLSSMGLLQ